MALSFKKSLLLILGAGFFYGTACIFAQENSPGTLTEEIAAIADPKEPSPEAKEETASAQAATVMEIKRLETEEPLYSFELRDVEIGDLFRVLAHDYKLNLLVDKEVSGTVTASLSNVSLAEALETIAEAQNLILVKKGKIIRVSPHLVTKIFGLKYIEAKGVLESQSSSGDSSSSQGATSNTLYDLLSEKGKILLGKQPNSIIVIDYPTNIAKIEEYLKEMDRKMTSRVFKLKYLKATEVVGSASNTTSTSSSSAPATPAGTGNSTTGSF